MNFSSDGTAHISVWAPLATSLEVYLPDSMRSIQLSENEHHYWTTITKEVKPGDRYLLNLNGELLPDPRALSMPDGISGPGRAVDVNSFGWTDEGWKNFPLKNYLIYELHTGTFTSEGTFEGIIKKLPYLADLGINAIEIMPVAQFPGNRNWGYDGVFPFAVQNSYGGPEGLQRLVNACHQNGIAVILDVVINHIGPEGNILEKFGPFFTDKYKTPWGRAINFDDAYCDGVREYFAENILMWFRDFHVDAIRLDAVHAIRDFSPEHILASIRRQVDDLKEKSHRTHYLIAECDLNDTRYIRHVKDHGFGMDAQWIDEFHHALRVATGHPRDGYYEDFNGVEHLAKSFNDGYVYTGEYSTHRKKSFGMKSIGLSSDKFVVFSQNHDQVGNRMLGERTSTLHDLETLKLLGGTVITSPFIPLLFMGEEYGETNPFQYFIHHESPELVEAVRSGRKKEFEAFFQGDEFPDPQSEETFLKCKLDWTRPGAGQHKVLFSYYKKLIQLRKELPVLSEPHRSKMEILTYGEQRTIVTTRFGDRHHALCIYNFSEKDQVIPMTDDREWSPVFYSAHNEWGGAKDGFPKVQNEVRVAGRSILICTVTYV